MSRKIRGHSLNNVTSSHFSCHFVKGKVTKRHVTTHTMKNAVTYTVKI